MDEAGEPAPPYERDALRARRNAARVRRRRARRRGLALGAALLGALAAGVALGAGGGGSGAARPAGGTNAARAGAKPASGSLDRLVSLGRPVYCGGGRERLVALTFDDGPGPYTRFALDQLRRAGARVTWFLVGRNVAPHAGLLPSERALGELADHTWTHPALTGLSPADAESEIARTRDAVAAAGGQPVRVFRPPYGLRNDQIDATARRLGLVQVIWDVDSEDSAGADKHRIARDVIGSLHPGAIVLMHENRGQTIQALHKILPALRRQHLKAVPVSELLRRDPPSDAQLARGRAGCPRQRTA